MSIKVVAIVALALVGTLAAYHFTQRGGNKADVSYFTNITANGTNESHYVPNKVLMFQNYKTENRLKFGSSENNRRFEIFSDNVDIIDAHNAQKDTTYELGVTSLAHLTLEEFAALKLGFESNQDSVNVNGASSEIIGNFTRDEEFDWVKKGAVNDVKDQGSCGSCWSFSAVGALESLSYIKTGKRVTLSEQELIDCSTGYGNNGCNGGIMNRAFLYVKDKGIATSNDYPYTGTDGSCRSGKERAFNISGYQRVKMNSNTDLIGALKNQPVSVAVDASNSAFQLYKSGVVTGDACGTKLCHGVLAVGYGTLNNQAYIKVRNSWGTRWGDQGYILVGQAEGAGICGINMQASYPTA